MGIPFYPRVAFIRRHFRHHPHPIASFRQFSSRAVLLDGPESQVLVTGPRVDGALHSNGEELKPLVVSATWLAKGSAFRQYDRAQSTIVQTPMFHASQTIRLEPNLGKCIHDFNSNREATASSYF
jgi:hypothetical protein